MILAIDPGPEQSAWVHYSDGYPRRYGKFANAYVLDALRTIPVLPSWLVVERIQSFGMLVGAPVFDTCIWIGRFVEAYESRIPPNPAQYLYRTTIKAHVCGTVRAKGKNVRAALLDRYGGRAMALGNKRAPGPLYGMANDAWSALAVAVTYADQNHVESAPRTIQNPRSAPLPLSGDLDRS